MTNSVPTVSVPSTTRGVRKGLAAGAVLGAGALGAALLGAALLGGCAGPMPPVANRAALAEEAYARNDTIHTVSDALDRRLDAMLGQRVADLAP